MFCSQCGTEIVNGACPKCAPENEQEKKSYEPDYVEVKVKQKKKGFAYGRRVHGEVYRRTAVRRVYP